VKASTHTEIYRPFRGVLARGGRRWRPLAGSTLRSALSKKLPLLLFAPPAIATGGMAGSLIEVKSQIVGFHMAMDFFVLLIVAWYGSGMISEDVRRKAHLLYFARPLTRLDYLLGKWLPLVLLGSLATLGPGLVICTVAAFGSPSWSFVTEGGDTIWKMIAYSLISVCVQSSLVLAISSLTRRKAHALAVSLGFFALLGGLGAMLSGMNREHTWQVLSVFGCFRRVALAIFDMKRILHFHGDWNAGYAWGMLGFWLVLAWFVLFWRTRRLEVNG
jgi:hypothetical protein